MNNKAEIFANLLADVARETDVPEDMIASNSRNMDAVDARWILVKLLNRQGFYPSGIASLVNIKKRAVNNILSRFEDRLKTSALMALNYKTLKSKWGGRKRALKRYKIGIVSKIF